MAENVEITGLSFNFTSNTDDAVEGISKLSTAMDSLDIERIEEAKKNIASISRAINRLGKVDSGSIANVSEKIETMSGSMATLSGTAVKKVDTISSSVKSLGKAFKGIDLTIDPDQIDINEKAIEDKVKQKYEEAITKGTERAKESAEKSTSKRTFSFGDEDIFDTKKFDFNQIDIGKHAGDVNEASSGYEKLSEALKKIGTALPSILPSVGKLGGSFLDATRKTEMFALSLAKAGATNVIKKISSLGDAVKSVGSKIKEGAKSLASMGIEKFTSKITSASNSVSKFVTSLGRIAMYRAIRTIIKDFTSSLSEGISNLYSWSNAVNGSFAPSMDRIATSTAYAKNALGAMVSPIINALAPAIDFLISKLVSAMNVINQFFSALTGHGFWTKAIKLPKTWGNAVSSGAGKGSKAVKKLGKDAKKAFEPFLLDIDEINRLTKKSDSDSGSGSGGGGGGGAGADVGSMFENAPVDSAIKSLVDKIKKGKWEEVGGIIADKLNTITDSLDKWINNKFRPKAVAFANGLGRLLNGFVAKYHWETLGKTFADGLNALVDAGNTFLETFRFDKFGNAIGRGIDSAIKHVEWGSLGRLFGNYVNAIFETYDKALDVFAKNSKTYGSKLLEAIENTFTTIHWQTIGSAFANGLNTIIGIGSSFFADPSRFSDYGALVYSGIDTAIVGVHWDELGKTLGKGITSIFSFFKVAVDQFSAQSGTYAQLISDSVNNVFENIGFDTIGETFKNGINGVINFFDTAISNFHWEANSALLFNGIDKTIKGINWKQLGETFGKLVTGVFAFISEGIKTFADNASTYAQKLMEAINGFISKVNWQEIGRTFVTGFNGVVTFLGDSVKNMDWQKVKTDIVGSLNDTISSIDASGFGEAVGDLVSHISDLFGSVDWSTVGFKVGQALGKIDWAGTLTTVGKAIFDGLKGAIEGFFDSAGVSGLWQAPAMALTLFGPGVFAKISMNPISKAVFGRLKTAFLNCSADSFGIPALMSKVGGFFTSNFPAVTSAIGGLGTTMSGAFSTAIGAVGAFLTSPAGLAILGVVGLTAIVSNWDKISSFIGGLGSKAISILGTVVSGVASGLGTLLGTLVKTVIDGVKKIFDGVTKEFDKFLKNPLKWGADLVSGFLKGILGAVVGIGKWVVDHLVTPFVKGFCDALGIHSPSTVFKGYGGNIVEGLINGISDMLGAVKDIAGKLVSAVVDVVKGIGSKLSDIWKGVKTTATNVWNGLKGSASTIWGGMKTTITNVASNVKEKVTDHFNKASSNVNKAMKNLSTYIANHKSSILSGASNIVSGVSNKFSGMASKGLTWGKHLISGLASSIRGGYSTVTSAASFIASGISSFLHFTRPDEGPLRPYEKWMPDFIDGLSKTLSKSSPKLFGEVKSVAETVSSIMNKGLEFNDDAITSMSKSYREITDSASSMYKELSSNVSATMPNVSYSYSNNIDNQNGVDEMVGVLKDIYSMIASGSNVNINIDGKEVFNAVVKENEREKIRMGYSPL